MTSGIPTDEIHFFCTADIPVGKRHKMQRHASDILGVELEVHDGQAISWYLAEPDTFWIAEEFLGLTSDLHPRQSRSSIGAPFAPVHNIPFRPSRHFVGRGAVLKSIRSSLLEGSMISGVTQCLVIHGLGGIGKTQLVLEYAWQNMAAGNYRYIFWVRGEDADTLRSGLANLAESGLLDSDPARAAGKDDTISAVVACLRQMNEWLMIIDNADTHEAVEAVQQYTSRLLSAGPHFHPAAHQKACGHILMTSRSAEWPSSVRSLSVELLDRDSAEELVVSLVSAGSDRDLNLSDVTQLVEQLDRLPLALEQAAATIRRMNWSIAHYLRRFTESDYEMLMKHSKGGTDYPLPVAKTWSVTVQLLNPLARSILRLAAFLSAERIPVSLFLRSGGKLRQAITLGVHPSELKSRKAQIGEIEDALGELSGHSMIKLSETEFSIHRLVQLVQRNEIEADRLPEWWSLVASILDQNAPDPPEHTGTWPPTLRGGRAGWERLHPLIEAVPGECVSGPLRYKVERYLSAKRICWEVSPLERFSERIFAIGFGSDHLSFCGQLFGYENRNSSFGPPRSTMDALHTRESRENRFFAAAGGLSHNDIAVRVACIATFLYETHRLDEAKLGTRRTSGHAYARHASLPPRASYLNLMENLVQHTSLLDTREREGVVFRDSFCIQELVALTGGAMSFIENIGGKERHHSYHGGRYQRLYADLVRNWRHLALVLSQA